MGFFKSGMTSGQRSSFKSFIKSMDSSLAGLSSSAGRAGNTDLRDLYREIRLGLRRTKFGFFDRNVLRRGMARGGASVQVMGENQKTMYTKVTAAGAITFLKSTVSLPRHHVFRGDKMKSGGAATLTHEIVHSAAKRPKAGVKRFFAGMGVPKRHTEEVTSDFMTIRIMKKMGYSTRAALSVLRGRRGYYGRSWPRIRKIALRIADPAKAKKVRARAAWLRKKRQAEAMVEALTLRRKPKEPRGLRLMPARG